MVTRQAILLVEENKESFSDNIFKEGVFAPSRSLVKYNENTQLNPVTIEAPLNKLMLVNRFEKMEQELSRHNNKIIALERENKEPHRKLHICAKVQTTASFLLFTLFRVFMRLYKRQNKICLVYSAYVTIFVT